MSPDSPTPRNAPPRPVSPPPIPKAGTIHNRNSRTDKLDRFNRRIQVSEADAARLFKVQTNVSAFDYGTQNFFSREQFSELSHGLSRQRLALTATGMYQKELAPYVQRLRACVGQVSEARAAYLKLYRKSLFTRRRKQREGDRLRLTSAGSTARPFLSGGSHNGTSKHGSQISRPSPGTYRSCKGEQFAHDHNSRESQLLASAKVTWQRALEKLAFCAMDVYHKSRLLRERWAMRCQIAKTYKLQHFILSAWVHFVKISIERNELQHLTTQAMEQHRKRRCLYAIRDYATADIREQIWLMKAQNVLGMRMAKRVLFCLRQAVISSQRSRLGKGIAMRYAVERYKSTAFFGWKAQHLVDRLLTLRTKMTGSEMASLPSKNDLVSGRQEAIWLHMSTITSAFPLEQLNELTKGDTGSVWEQPSGFYGQYEDTRKAIALFDGLGDHHSLLTASRKQVFTTIPLQSAYTTEDREVASIHRHHAQDTTNRIPPELLEPSYHTQDESSSIVPIDIAVLNPTVP